MTVEVDVQSPHTIEVGLYVRDAERSLAFYRDTLGFEVFGSFSLPDRRAWGLRLGNSCVKLLQTDGEIEAQNPPGVAIGYRYMTIHAVDLQATEDLCRERGYEIVLPLTQFDEIPARFGACEVFMVLDPDGNRIELCDGLPWVEPDTATA